MGTTLTGTTPQDTYDSLIKVTDNGPLSGTAKYLSDGLGNDSVLALSTARVGIGTTSPSSAFKLTVNSGSNVNSFLNGDKISFSRTSDNATDVAYLSRTNDLGVNGTANIHGYDGIQFRTQGPESVKATITSAGNVGIGTSSPSGKLNVVHTASTTVPALKIESSGTLANNDILRIQVNGLTNGFRIFQNASSEVKYTFSDGQMGIGTEAPAVPLDVVGNIRSSTGILFGSDTAAANALDDYEEGTFTPTIIGSTTAGTATYSGGQAGTYTKIGNVVYFQLYLGYSGGTGTGDLRIAGLPFTIPSNDLPSFTFGAFLNVALTASNIPLAGGIASTNQITIEQIPTGGGSQTAVPYDASAVIQISGFYRV